MARELCPLCADDYRVEEINDGSSRWLVCTAHQPAYKIARVEKGATPSARIVTGSSGRGSLPAELWDDYDRWNVAIFRALFARAEGLPVYLDLEEQTLSELAELAVGGSEDPSERFLAAVCPTLERPPSDRRLLHHHIIRARRWLREGREMPPPFLAVLALFSLVAERMVSDADFRANNYYVRLCQALSVDQGDERAKAKIERDFRHHSREFWDLLNQWLLDSDGAFGLPTAAAFDYRVHVGVPISQALLREGDRSRLFEFFASARLSPRQRVSTTDMARLLGDWLPASSMSAAVKNAWRHTETREQIAAVVCAELEAWEGGESRPSLDRESPLRLAAALRGFPRPRIDLDLLVRESHAIAGTYRVVGEVSSALTAPESRLTVGPRIGDWRAFDESDQISFPDVLIAAIELSGEESSTSILKRAARRVMVLQEDPELNWFIEVEHAQLGSGLIVLAVDAAAEKAKRALDQVARPGFRTCREEELLGLPKDWTAFLDVQLLDILGGQDPDLAALVPLAWTQITLASGLRLPGRVDAWHRSQLPEVRVTVPNRGDCVLWLERERLWEEDQLPPESTRLFEFEGAVVSQLQGGLKDGDYRLYVRSAAQSEQSRPLATAQLRVRSADSSLLHVARPNDLQYGRALDKDRAWAMLSAEATSGDQDVGSFVLGGAGEISTPVSAELARQPALSLPARLVATSADGFLTEHPDRPPQTTRPRATSTAACFATGAHHFVLPTFYPGRRGPERIEGRCKHCDLEKWWPARPRSVLQMHYGVTRDAATAITPLRDVAPIKPAKKIDFDTLLDALSYAYAGSWHSFERLARSINDTPWFASEAAAVLGALGHLELALNPLTLRPEAWSVTPPAFVGIRSGSAVLCGFRSRSLLEAAGSSAERHGAKLLVEPQIDAPARVELASGETDAVAGVAASLPGWWGPGIKVCLKFADRLSRGIATAGSVVERLPSASPPRNVAIERFDVSSVTWQRVDEADAAGAYRFYTIPFRYLFRSVADTTTECFRLGDVRMVKHLAAALVGKPMVAYEPERQLMLCHLGAALPGLYERAAVLCSGHAPMKRQDGSVAYRDVPAGVAVAIVSALANGVH